MERMKKIELLKLTSGYYFKVQGIICCVMLSCLFFFGKIDNLIWLLLVMMMLTLFLCLSLLIEYFKVGRILRNGIIIETKVVDAERTYYGLKYEFLLRMGSVFLQSTYYDQEKNCNYFFKTYTDKRNFSCKKQLWENELLKLDCDYVKVYVNRDNYNDYIFVFNDILL